MNTNNSDFNIGIHEGGHAVCAAAFRIPAYPEILHNGKSIATQTTNPNYAGLCSFDDGPIKPFHHAVISWGGPLAEALYGTPPDWFPPYKPTALLLKDWWAAMATQLKRFSEGDRAGILAGYKNSWRACKSAYRITKRNKARIVRLAMAMTAGRKATPSMPLPEKFPATHADFVRLICASDETSFERFIVSKAQSHLAGGAAENFESAKQSMTAHFLGTVTDELRARHASKPDAEIAEIMFAENFASITNLQRTIYGGGFPDADSWLAAARDFKAWQASVNALVATPLAAIIPA
jgi:hypothetical protein